MTTAQLTLFKTKPRPQESNVGFNIFDSLRRDAANFLAAVNYVNETRFTRLCDVPLEAMKAARAFLTPGFYKPQADPMTMPVLPGEVKLLKQRPAITKQRTRCTKMLNRLRKKTPLLTGVWMAEAQGKMVANPEYYGVCVAIHEGSCVLNLGQKERWDRQQKAIDYENELRKRGID